MASVQFYTFSSDTRSILCLDRSSFGKVSAAYDGQLYVLFVLKDTCMGRRPVKDASTSLETGLFFWGILRSLLSMLLLCLGNHNVIRVSVDASCESVMVSVKGKEGEGGSWRDAARG